MASSGQTRKSMRRMKRLGVALGASVVIAMLAPIAGCGSNALHEAGTACSADDDCAAGLSCLGIGNGTGGSCVTVARACTKSCSSDLDCLAVGSGFRCLPSCSAASTCVQTRVLSD